MRAASHTKCRRLRSLAWLCCTAGQEPQPMHRFRECFIPSMLTPRCVPLSLATDCKLFGQRARVPCLQTRIPEIGLTCESRQHAAVYYGVLGMQITSRGRSPCT